VIAPTKLADLVLLDANPLDTIANTQSIWRTVKGGRVFDPLTNERVKLMLGSRATPGLHQG